MSVVAFMDGLNSCQGEYRHYERGMSLGWLSHSLSYPDLPWLVKYLREAQAISALLLTVLDAHLQTSLHEKDWKNAQWPLAAHSPPSAEDSPRSAKASD